MYRFDSYDNSLVIDGWEKGISESPYGGISDMRNVNMTSIPGEASVNFATSTVTLGDGGTGSVTNSSASGDTVSISGAGAVNMVVGMAVKFAGGSLPTGIVAATVYWIAQITSQTSTTATFQLSTSPSVNNTVDITSDGGTGTYNCSFAVMGKPVARTKDSWTATIADTFKYFIVDSNGLPWGYNGSKFIYVGVNNSNETTNAHGNGIIAYNGYVFIFRNDKIDYISIASLQGPSAPTTSYGWKTLITGSSTNNTHQALVSYNDSKVYFCDSNHVTTFYQNIASATFDPTDATTYTYTQAILDLPANDIAQCLTELGSNLLIGGQLNAIYPWDRTVRTAGSAGNLSVLSVYSQPILVAEGFISRMVTVNTNTYIFAGVRGRIYVTNGSQASFFKKMPDHISGTVEPYFQWGDANATKNQLYFGVSCTTNAAGTNSQYGGLWAIDLDSTALRLAQKLSYNTYAGIASVVLPIAITSSSSTPAGTGLFIGWDSGASTYGMDITTTAPYTTSVATIDADLIPIGTFNKPRDLTQVEFRLSRPMVSGESILIKTRLIFNTSDTGYSTTLTNSAVGSWSGTSPINFKKAQWCQFQIVLNSTASSPSYVRLREIRIMGLTGPAAQNSPSLSL